jgi:hypothetical protein
MLTLQTTLPPAVGTPIARPAAAPETQAAVPPSREAEGARNNGARERGAEAERLAREVAARTRDPRAPVGPPPAFEANVLEARSAELRKPPDPGSAGRDAGEPAATDYHGLPEAAEPELDLAR